MIGVAGGARLVVHGLVDLGLDELDTASGGIAAALEVRPLV